MDYQSTVGGMVEEKQVKTPADEEKMSAQSLVDACEAQGSSNLL